MGSGLLLTVAVFFLMDWPNTLNEMNREKLKSQIEGINVWKKGAQRAPHKPLLLLYALARSRRNRDRFIPYTEVGEKLKQLLIDFGPTRRSYHPEYPIWRLLA